MTRIASTSRAFAWVAAGAIGATVVTGVAFAGGGSHGGGGQSSDRHKASGGSSVAPEVQNDSASGDPTASDPTRSKQRGKLEKGRFGHGPRLGPWGRPLHGEFVVAGKDGNPVTVMVQSGIVTEVSATSITVKSSDNFVATYVINGDTKIRARHEDDKSKTTAGKRAAATAADIAVDDNVWIVATVDGSNANASWIVARSPKVKSDSSTGDSSVTPPAVFRSSLFGI